MPTESIVTTDTAVPVVDASATLARGPAGSNPIWKRPFPKGAGRLVVVGLVSLLAGAGLGFAMARAAQPPVVDPPRETYLAYAISGQKGTLGSGSGDSPAQAQLSAEAGCRANGGGPSCQGVIWWNNGAISIAATSGASGKSTWSYFLDDDPNSTVPEESARNHCSSCDQMLNLSVTGQVPFNSGGTQPLHFSHTATLRRGTGKNQVAMVFASTFSQPVYPIRSGRVVFAGPSDSQHPSDGDTVVVYHDEGVYSAYAELDSVNLIAVGTEVTPQMHLGKTRGGSCSGNGASCWQVDLSVVDLASHAPVTGRAALSVITRGSPLPLPWTA